MKQILTSNFLFGDSSFMYKEELCKKKTLIYKVPCRNHPNTELIDENVKNVLTYDRHQAVSLSNASVQSQASGSLEIQKS